MRNEFIQAINQVCAERNLSKEVVIEAVEVALVSAYKRNFGEGQNVVCKIDQQTGDVNLFTIKEVVESVTDADLQIPLTKAQEIQADAAIGTTVMLKSTPPKDFGRIAAQTAKQVILQRIREAERDTLFQSYADRVGEMINAAVQTVEPNMVTVNLGKTEGIMPRSEWIYSEKYRPTQRLRVVIVDVDRGTRGPDIIVSRSHRDLLRRLLEMEVPEILNGAVEIKSVAREAGSRSKVAVFAKQPRLDPVGACVGQRGYRIQNIVNELSGEKIDVVAWSADMATFIGNALSPAKPTDVHLDETAEGGKTATVIVPDKQLSLAIGKEGQNVRLAAKLTGWRIDIKSTTEREEEARLAAERAAAQPTEEDLLAKAEAILLGKEAAAVPEDSQEAPVMAEAEGVEPKAQPVVLEEPSAEPAKVEASVEPTVELAAEAQKTVEEAAAPVAETASAQGPEIPVAAVPTIVELTAELGADEESEAEEENGKPAKKKPFKKGRQGAPQQRDAGMGAWRKQRKPERRRDRGGSWGGGED
jgi:N utilization substance protein A